METFLVIVVSVGAGIGCAWIYGGFPTKAWRQALSSPSRADEAGPVVPDLKLAGALEPYGGALVPSQLVSEDEELLVTSRI